MAVDPNVIGVAMTRGPGDPIQVGFAVMVTLEEATITRLLSKDWSRTREGFVSIEADAGFPIVLPWTGRTRSRRSRTVALDTSSQANLQDQVVFYGRPSAATIPLSVKVVEADDKSREALRKVTKAFSAAGGIASIVPPYGGAAQSGFNLASVLSGLVSRVVDNDVELEFYGSFCHTGTHTLTRTDNGHGVGVRLQFNVVQVAAAVVPRAPRQNERQICVFLEALSFSQRANKKESYVFNTITGPAKTQQSFSFAARHKNGDAHLRHYFALSNAVLFRGPWPDAGTGLRFSLSLGTAKLSSVDEADVVQLLQAAAGFAKAVANAAGGGIAAHVDDALTASQNATTLYFAIADSSKEIGVRSAVLNTGQEDSFDMRFGNGGVAQLRIKVLPADPADRADPDAPAPL